MAKLRSYNQELLIAASLIASVLNDVIIERRKHIQGRDYSKPLNIKDIFQKNIEVPCIFGDRSIILKSLQNHEGAIKLPLFVLQSSNIKTDQVRLADLHLDMIYQCDSQFFKLPKDHPLYRPYDLRKRRPLPITVDYQLSLIAKYKEDLDQMMTNWMVHCQPDLYVKWWHPRDKSMPLESQILWSQSLNYKKPDQQPTTRYQYQATTNFTFKTWIFPGLDYQQDQFHPEEQGIIKYFNWFPTDINTTGVEGTEGYPTIGELGATPAGFYAVPSDMEFQNDGSDLSGVQNGKYFINNLVKYPSGKYASNVNIDLDGTADILTKDTWDIFPSWNQYQDYCQFDNISNERIGIKAIYFEGGYPLSCMLQTGNPSGDFLFHHFCSEGNDTLDKSQGFIGSIKQDQFGANFTDSLQPIISYNFEQKILTISGMSQNQRYKFNIYSQISSTSGITEGLVVSNVPQNINYKAIKLQFVRQTDTDLNIINSNSKRDNFLNVNLLNTMNFKHDKDNVMFTCETGQQQKKYQKLKSVIQNAWDKLEIYPCTDDGQKLVDLDLENHNYKHYKLYCKGKRFQADLRKYYNYQNLTLFYIRDQFVKNGIQYTFIANNNLYFIMSDDGIYDWGLIHMPRFATKHYPIFQVTHENAKLIYGIGMDCKLASAAH